MATHPISTLRTASRPLPHSCFLRSILLVSVKRSCASSSVGALSRVPPCWISPKHDGELDSAVQTVQLLVRRTVGDIKWRRWGAHAGFVGGIWLIACREIINLIKWRSRLLFFLFTVCVTNPQNSRGPETKAPAAQK